MVAILRWIHLFPFRTQQLSIARSKVLGGRPPGRIDSCQMQGTLESERPLLYTANIAVRQLHKQDGGFGEAVNTPDCGSGTRGFDPHKSPQNTGV